MVVWCAKPWYASRSCYAFSCSCALEGSGIGKNNFVTSVLFKAVGVSLVRISAILLLLRMSVMSLVLHQYDVGSNELYCLYPCSVYFVLSWLHSELSFVREGWCGVNWFVEKYLQYLMEPTRVLESMQIGFYSALHVLKATYIFDFHYSEQSMKPVQTLCCLFDIGGGNPGSLHQSM